MKLATWVKSGDTAFGIVADDGAHELGAADELAHGACTQQDGRVADRPLAVVVRSSGVSVASFVLGRAGSRSRMILRIASTPRDMSSFGSKGVLPASNS